MSGDFAEATAITAAGPGRFLANVPTGWEQGRGAYGGLVLGLLGRALVASEPERPLRTMMGEIPAPVVAGPAEIHVTTTRRGTKLTSLDARLLQEGETRARATGLLGLARAPDVRFPSMTPPALPADLEALPVVPMAPPLGPTFTQHVTMRCAEGQPLSRAGDAAIVGSVAFRECSSPSYGAPELTGLVDVFWPALLVTESRMRPMATIAFTAEYFGDAFAPGDLAFRSRAVAGHEGYVSEVRELWTLDGHLAALNQQTFCVIR
ncbi:MAG: thioesterase family protein [Myxococcota bacterium]